MKTWSLISMLLPPGGGSAAVMLVLMAVMMTVLSPSSSYAPDHDLDDDDDTSMMLPEEGSGPDDEDMSSLFTDVMASDVTFRCYRCTGITEKSGCNVTSLRENPLDYVTECNGHCLNISTADNTVFDCTEDVLTIRAKCFQKDDILMCICSTDLCNGPPLLTHTPDDVIQLPTSQREINMTSQQNANKTSRGFSATSQVNITSKEVSITSSKKEVGSKAPSNTSRELSMTSQKELNITAGKKVSSTSQKDVSITSQKDTINMTSFQENISSKEISMTSERDANKVTVPETSKQRQHNRTVIEAASVSEGAAARNSDLYVVFVMVEVVSVFLRNSVL